LANNYDNIDLYWGWSGDFAIDKKGDLKDTTYDAIRSLLQDIHTVCASSLNDWEFYPNLGATLDDFCGEPNTQTTAAAVENRLKVSLIAAGIVNEEDLAIRVIPVHTHRILIVIGVNTLATAFNSLEPGDKLVTSLVFDTVEQQVTFMEQTPVQNSG